MVRVWNGIFLNTVPDRNAGMKPVAHLPIIFPDNRRPRPTKMLLKYKKNSSIKNYLESEFIPPFFFLKRGFQICYTIYSLRNQSFGGLISLRNNTCRWKSWDQSHHCPLSGPLSLVLFFSQELARLSAEGLGICITVIRIRGELGG